MKNISISLENSFGHVFFHRYLMYLTDFVILFFWCQLLKTVGLQRIPLVPSVFGTKQLNSVTSRLRGEVIHFQKNEPTVLGIVTKKTHQNENPCKVCKAFQFTNQKVWKAFLSPTEARGARKPVSGHPAWRIEHQSPVPASARKNKFQHTFIRFSVLLTITREQARGSKI